MKECKIWLYLPSEGRSFLILNFMEKILIKKFPFVIKLALYFQLILSDYKISDQNIKMMRNFHPHH